MSVRGKESGIGKVVAREIDAREIVICQLNAGQIVGSVAGGGSELGHRESGEYSRVRRVSTKDGSPDFGPGQVRPGQPGPSKVRIREIGIAQVCAGQISLSRGVPIEISIRKVGLAEIRINEPGTA